MAFLSLPPSFLSPSENEGVEERRKPTNARAHARTINTRETHDSGERKKEEKNEGEKKSAGLLLSLSLSLALIFFPVFRSLGTLTGNEVSI